MWLETFLSKETACLEATVTRETSERGERAQEKKKHTENGDSECKEARRQGGKEAGRLKETTTRGSLSGAEETGDPRVEEREQLTRFACAG